ncbi:hypothetical protein N0V85_009315 [Neurospora sp. IMI 360204]|nr:hypothetical protein N0V85_009315 [Neurospora sp. IMI 360204]
MTSIPNQNRKTSHPSHLPTLPLQPTPASLLLSQDPRLTQRLQNRNGFFSTGCRELDSHILLNGGGLNGGGLGGGFEGSCVVGLSCEEEETIGLAIGLQVIARMVLLSSDESKAKAKAMIITTLSTTSLLPRLRLAVVSEARALLQGNGNGQQKQVDRGVIKSCLERVLVARVFDAEGLREVLRELEGNEAGSSSEEQEKHPQQQQQQWRRRQGNDMQEENEQSHDGGENSSSKKNSKNGHLPDLILITNTSHLLNTLFTRNKTGSDSSQLGGSAI